MTDFKVGDKVVIRSKRANVVFDGVDYQGMTATIIKPESEATGDVMLMPDTPRRFSGELFSHYTGKGSDSGFFWPANEVFLRNDSEPDLDDLRRVVSALRARGMKVTVTVERTITDTVEV